MIAVEVFSKFAFKCPLCHQIHQCEKQHPKWMETWTEECPKTETLVCLINIRHTHKF